MSLVPELRLPYTNPEERRPHYADVQSMIVPGFLSQKCQIGDKHICLRSLNQGDIFLLQHRGVDNSSWRIWAIATATWMFDGQLTTGHPNKAYELYKLYSQLPTPHIKILFDAMMSLFHKARRALKDIESFSYEKDSRILWRSLKGQGPINSDSVSGIPGIGKSGLNNVQKLWVFFNNLEDQRDEDEVVWQSAKFVASAHAPKGVKQVESKEENRKDRENQRRQYVHDKFYYLRIGRLTEDQLEDLEKTGRLSSATKSKEELAREMEMWVKGEMDFHDFVVHEYKEKIRQKFEEERRFREERRIELEQAQSTKTPGKTRLAVSSEEINKILNKRKGPKRIYDTGNAQTIFHKHLKDDPAPPPEGGFVATPSGELLPAKAVKISNATLDEKIRGRNIVVKPDESSNS